VFFNENLKYDGIFDETKFIIGIDIGNNNSALSFFDFNTNKIEQLDISGGYGKASVPTVVQYIKDTDEWVFGEYALMNKPLSDSVTFDNLILGLGKKNRYTVGGKVVSHSYILSLFIKELLENVRNINPNAEIVGIAASVSYLNEEAESELLEAFSDAGYLDKLIGLFSVRECVLNKYCFEEKEIPSKVIILDFGSREIRGGFFSLFENNGDIVVNLNKVFFDSNISTAKIEKKLYYVFEKYFKENTGEMDISDIHKLQLEAFTYQYKDLIFKSKGGIKLYFNFQYPPFQKSVEKEDIEDITQEFKVNFHEFLEKVFQNSNLRKNDGIDIDKVLCCGGGFEMFWAKQVIVDIFGENRSVIYKNPKNILSQGACIIAVKYFEAVNTKKLLFLENSICTNDIGLVFCEKDGYGKFVPFIEKGAFLWRKFESKNIIVNEVYGSLSLDIFKKDVEGNLIIIGRIILDDLPKRPKGTNCLNVLFEYVAHNKIAVKIEDMGFGDFFAKTDYAKNVVIELE